VELVLQITHGLTVRCQLWVHAVFVLHDLVHDQLRGSRHLIPSSMVIRRSLIMASYSAALFDVGKCSRIECSMRT
jgi:hypothetical protein